MLEKITRRIFPPSDFRAIPVETTKKYKLMVYTVGIVHAYRVSTRISFYGFLEKELD